MGQLCHIPPPPPIPTTRGPFCSISPPSGFTISNILPAQGYPNALAPPPLASAHQLLIHQEVRRRRRQSPHPIMLPAKGPAFHLTHLRTKGKSTGVLTYKKKPEHLALSGSLYKHTSPHRPITSSPGSFLDHLRCQWQTLVRLGFTFICCFLLFPRENHQRQAGLRLFRVRNIVLIMSIVPFPDWGEKRKLMFRSTKAVGFHGGEQGFS